MSYSLVRKVLLGLIGFSFYPAHVMADQYHYHNIVPGDRAMGLGGAYAGVSDDAQGVIYNPAGMAFALSNDVSGSANAFYTKKVEYKDVVESDSFVEESTATFAPFFGGLQKLDNISPGLIFAFAVYNTDSELQEQNDKITGKANLVAFRRTANVRASTLHIGIAAAKRLNSKLSFGFGMNYIKVDELSQIYQDVFDFKGSSTTESGTKFYGVRTVNDRRRLLVNVIQPVLGVQYAPIPKISLGLSLKVGIIANETYEILRNVTQTQITEDGSYVTKEISDADGGKYGDGTIERGVAEDELDNAMKEWPLQVRAGLAFFASPRFLWTFDVIYHGKTGEGDKTSEFKREAVTNIATGTEYYVTPSIPLRFGLMTNFDTRPEPKEGEQNQLDHVNYYGLTAFVGWVQPQSQLQIGIMSQLGEGKAQKVAGNTNINKVVAEAHTLAVSATHSF